jgi:hypothetical protein
MLLDQLSRHTSPGTAVSALIQSFFICMKPHLRYDEAAAICGVTLVRDDVTILVHTRLQHARQHDQLPISKALQQLTAAQRVQHCRVWATPASLHIMTISNSATLI